MARRVKPPLHSTAPPPPIERLLMPIQQFMRAEAAGGILLLVCTVIALVWANSPLRESYAALWNTTVTVGFGGFEISKALILWVNDGLMAIFFFVVGLEIKREVLVGELASMRQAALPIAAAVGGMVAPALLYVLVNLGGEGMDGWAVPAATDIAFALGVMALLGSRVPTSLKVFLTALAIVDDIGAVLIIALFYSHGLHVEMLLLAGVVVLLLIGLNRLGVRSPHPYMLLGIVLWVAFLKSGIHATIAGVVLAITIPVRMRINTTDFAVNAHRALDWFDRAGTHERDLLANTERQVAVQSLEDACQAVQTPLSRIEHALLPLTAFFIMPVFALANAGVGLGEGFLAALTHPVALGIIAGLVLGKQLGIMACLWLAVRLGLGTVLAGTNSKQLYATSWLAGIGFTMSLFIANLAFGEGSELLEVAKIGILTASLVSGVVGYALLRATTTAPARGHADEPQ